MGENTNTIYPSQPNIPLLQPTELMVMLSENCKHLIGLGTISDFIEGRGAASMFSFLADELERRQCRLD